MSKLLCLADFEGSTEEEIKEHIRCNYLEISCEYSDIEESPSEVELLEDGEILIAYESIGNYGCDSSGFFVFMDKDGSLWENHSSHCSCYGMEGQWEPSASSIEYLLSDHFCFDMGGYDPIGYSVRKTSIQNHLRMILLEKGVSIE